MKRVRLPLLALLLGALFLPRLGAAAISFDGQQLAVPEDSIPVPASLPYVDRIWTHPVVPNTAESTVLILEGRYPYACGRPAEAQTIDPGHVAFTVRPSSCTNSSHRWLEGFDLGFLPAGFHQVEIEMTVLSDSTSDSTAVGEETYRGVVGFTVMSRDTIPPPGPLPYVETIRILPKPNMLPVERAICPEDSILVLFSGHFPNDCYVLKDVQILDFPTFAVGPPLVRLIVDDQACAGRLCIEQPVLWSASVVLGPLPAGSYGLTTELGEVSCTDSIPPDRLYTTNVPFSVVDTCGQPPPPQACLVGAFSHPNGLFQCDATVSASHAAVLNLGVNSTVALAGLQGRLGVYPPVLQITRLEPIGPAAAMHLSWTPSTDGARFVLFAEHGAPIPPAPWPAEAVVPILRVTLQALVNTPVPELTHVTPLELLGSDENGGGVPICPLRDARLADIFSARVCLERLCDYNGDGALDVRDLVLMVRCLNGEGPCRDTSGAIFDCNRDQEFTLDDILCCARRLLGTAICPDCPPDTMLSRPEPRVSLSLGPPSGTAAGVDLPLSLHGADRIGAARLALSYPSDRYEVTSVEFPGSPSEWLNLYQVENSEITIGLIATAEQSVRTVAELGTIDMILHLALRNGQQPGGSVQLTDAEFSGPDGVMLEVETGSPAQALGGPAKLSLSPSRPNPFTGETRFTLTLDQAADVEVGIYDVGGRLVAPLFSGRLPAGARDFVWNGARSGGGRAANGIYFYRVASRGKTISGKMILLRGN